MGGEDDPISGGFLDGGLKGILLFPHFIQLPEWKCLLMFRFLGVFWLVFVRGGYCGGGGVATSD